MAWMTISVVRLLGVDAIPPRELRIRGIASPIKGTAGCSKSRRSGCCTGWTVGIAISLTVGAVVGAAVGVGLNVILGMGIGV